MRRSQVLDRLWTVNNEIAELEAGRDEYGFHPALPGLYEERAKLLGHLGYDGNPVAQMARRNASAGDGWDYPDDQVAVEAAIAGEDDFSPDAREAALGILFRDELAPDTRGCPTCGRVHLLSEVETHCQRCGQIVG